MLHYRAGADGHRHGQIFSSVDPINKKAKRLDEERQESEPLYHFSPERAAIRAGRIMLKQIHLLADRARDFAFETTLSGRTYVRLLRDFRGRGYQIHLFFLWVPSIDIALERIADRVRRGGHNVPEDIVRRRFKKGLPNLFQLYRPLLDSWVIFDNSSDTPNMIAFEKLGQLQIVASDLFAKLSRSLEVL